MNDLFFSVALTDAGVHRRVNQDAFLVKSAKSARFGRICFAVLCDGLGGLSLGERASAFFVRRMEHWFSSDFLRLMEQAGNAHLDAEQCLHRCRLMWQGIVMEENEQIGNYGKRHGISLGTTAVMFLLIGTRFTVMHVGDSRLYLAQRGALQLLTHDHSLIQQQIDAGILTLSQARRSDKKSVLLQCIGASRVVRPDFRDGILHRDAGILLCSDGFWRQLSDEELLESMNAGRHRSEDDARRDFRQRILDVKKRGETDNITVIYLEFTTKHAVVSEHTVRLREQAVPC